MRTVLFAADGQPLTAFCAAPFQDQTAILGAHAHEKSVRPLTVASIRLERTLAFHGGSARLTGGQRDVLPRHTDR